MYRVKVFNELIKEICNENLIEYQELSDDWIIKLTKNGVNRFIVGYRFDLNTQAMADIFNDKFALYAVCKSCGVPIIESSILFKNDEEKLEGLFELYGKNVVLKPNNGTCGNNVFHITDFNVLVSEFRNLISCNYSLDICPYYDIVNEYRAIYLDGKRFFYKKIRPFVYGDGVSTVRELLVKFNPHFFEDEQNFKNKLIDINYVPKAGELVKYEWRFNLSKGAIIDDVSDEEVSLLNSFIDRVICKINLRFGSIDIIKVANGDLLLMEINSGVMMENLVRLKDNGRFFAKEIYSEAIKKMFE